MPGFPNYSLQLSDCLRRGDYDEVSPTPEAAHPRSRTPSRGHVDRVVTGCNSWYLDQHGVPASWTFSHERFVAEMTAPRMADFDTR